MTETTARWLCHVVGHKWMMGGKTSYGSPAAKWDGICAVRWCQRCEQMQVHYSSGVHNWWEVVEVS